ncbi:MAG: FliI/YscN family ATPase, partial [Alphaproteobacteria bacterium]
DGRQEQGEILALSGERAVILPGSGLDGLSIGTPVRLLGPARIAPDDSWLGRVIDPSGKPLDGRPILQGLSPRPLQGAPINPAERRMLGARLETGLAVFNTLLPIVRGQRIGLFAGSGVGKSTLLAKLARGVRADVIVIGLIGERGREVREFVERVLGPEGMRRAVVVAATSDRSPLVRRRCGLTAMAVAEHFRDQGRHVLLLADSITRFAEAHREVALAAGESGSLRGFPPSTAHQITSLCERAGPGAGTQGDITAVFSVLVAGSDMEEPIADMLRGVLDGHVVLDRKIAERGRFPAIDLLRSVSRALPEAASPAENTLIAAARERLGIYDRSEMMVRAGLYEAGSDPVLDEAIATWPKLDAFLAEDEPEDTRASFRRLAQCLKAEEAE